MTFLLTRVHNHFAVLSVCVCPEPAAQAAQPLVDGGTSQLGHQLTTASDQDSSSGVRKLIRTTTIHGERMTVPRSRGMLFALAAHAAQAATYHRFDALLLQYNSTSTHLVGATCLAVFCFHNHGALAVCSPCLSGIWFLYPAPYPVFAVAKNPHLNLASQSFIHLSHARFRAGF